MTINTDTLIVLDEIQEAPRGITALKYFQEKAPEYHVMAAGSLLGIAMHHNDSFPVGKVDFMYLYPLSFFEFLEAVDEKRMVDAMTTYGADSFVGRLSCIFQGSTDTTFYILAVYFGSVGVRYTRHAVACGLLADLAGVVAAIAICYMFFG